MRILRIGRIGSAATVPCANVDSGCIAMARRHTVLQAFQFDPESDPDGEAPDKEVATQRLQQDVSEWLV